MSYLPPKRVALIVEGFGDVCAVPALLGRAAKDIGISIFALNNPIRGGGIKSLRKEGEFERHIALAASRLDADFVMLVIDCDEACPIDLLHEFLPRCKSTIDKYHKDIRICFVEKEFESWFLASHHTIRLEEDGYWDFSDNFPNYKNISGAKERLAKSMKGRTYKETRDQLIFAKRIDVNFLNEHDRSFRRFVKCMAA